MKRLISLAFIAVVTVLPACRENPSRVIVGTGTIQQWGGDCTGT
jgi:hypothetical protein